MYNVFPQSLSANAAKLLGSFLLGTLWVTGALAQESPDTPLHAATPTQTEALKSQTIPAGDTLDPVELKATIIRTEEYPTDLNTVLRLVAAQNLPLAQSEKNTEILKTRYRQTQAALLPDITGAYTQSKLEGGQQIFGGATIPVVRKTVQPQLSASWTIYPGGQQIFEMLAAKRRKGAALSQFNETYQEQLSRTTEEYYRLLAAYQQKYVAEQAIESAQEQVNLNETLVRVGRGVPLDLSRARTTLAQQQSSLYQAENAVMQAEQNLLNRLNLDSTIHLVPDEAEATCKALIPAGVDVATLIGEAVTNNPAVLTSIQELEALGMDYRAIRSNLIPSFTVRTYVNGTGPDRSSLVRNNFSGLTINVNLLENLGLAIPLRMQEAKKIQQQKLLQQKQLVRDIETQVMTTYLNSENYKSSINAAWQAVASAEESYELATGRYKAGYGINLDVLDAQTELTAARNTLTQAVLNYNQSQVQLVEALGLSSPAALTHGLTLQGISTHAQTP